MSIPKPIQWIASCFNHRNTKMMTDAMRYITDANGLPVVDKVTGQYQTTKCELREDKDGFAIEVLGLPGSPEHTASLALWRQGTVRYTENIQVEFEIDPKVVSKLSLESGSTADLGIMEVPEILPEKKILEFAKTSHKLRGKDKFQFRAVDGKPVEYSLAPSRNASNVIKRTDGDDTILIVSAVYKPSYTRTDMRTAW